MGRKFGMLFWREIGESIIDEKVLFLRTKLRLLHKFKFFFYFYFNLLSCVKNLL